jgi:outer membrane protein OmpA-like peptidoglycan-associated protein
VISTKRAGVVRDYLVQNGASPAKITYRGVGHDIVANTKNADQKSRISSQVEFKLLSLQ